MSRVSTCNSRPPISDASGRSRQYLYWFICTPSKPAVVLSPGTRVLLPPYQYRVLPLHWHDMYRDRHMVGNLHLTTYCEFFDICRFRGVSYPGMINLPLLLCGMQQVSLHRLDFLGYKIQECQCPGAFIRRNYVNHNRRTTLRWSVINPQTLLTFEENFSNLNCFHNYIKIFDKIIISALMLSYGPMKILLYSGDKHV